MLNRPRPRKIVTVVKSEPDLLSPKTESFSEENEEFTKKLAFFQEPKLEQPPVAAKPIQSMARRPVLSLAKKPTAPPPPSFSEVRSNNSSKGPSPVQSPTKIQSLPSRPSEGFDKIALSFAEVYHEEQANLPNNSPRIDSKSSGEKILDAADKAAEFIGETLLGRFGKISVGNNFADNDPLSNIITNLKPGKAQENNVTEQTFQELLCPTESDSFSELEKSPSYSISSQMSPTKSPPVTSPGSVSSDKGGFRSNILKHGLTALEKIGKTTAEVMVNTKNKITDANFADLETFTSQPVVEVIPDFNDSKSSFYETFNLYSGHSKLTELQLHSIKSSISMKFLLKSFAKSPSKTSSFDFNSRRKSQSRVAKNLHPDRIMEIMLNSDSENILFSSNVEFFNVLRSLAPVSKWMDNEIDLLQRMLQSLDSILVDGPGDLVSCNRRRHLLCQISVFWCQLLKEILNYSAVVKFDFEGLSCDLCTLVAHILKFLQKSLECCCNDSDRAISDHNSAAKLLIDITYTSVPIIQSFLFSGLN